MVMTTPSLVAIALPLSLLMGPLMLPHLHAEARLDPVVVGEKTAFGRTIVRYEHDSLPEWGYETPQRDYFHLVAPAKPTTGKAPLRVVLHSAGGSGESEMPTFNPAAPTMLHASCGDEFYGLFLDCRGNQKTDWWWGYHAIERAPQRYAESYTPAERRLIAEIEWVLASFPIDRDRVYLSGVSMGGSGSLGLGMCRGDLFAAINVIVPAYAKHALFRMQHGEHPDPPPVFDFTSQIDAWARGHEDFIAYCHANRFFLAMTWGHANHTGDARKFASPLGEFPWLTIRRNEAYPVFAEASTDNHYPGFQNTTAPDQHGQSNAFFRWHNLKDTESAFAMELRLIGKDELHDAHEMACPTTATADVTLRRLQRFTLPAGTRFSWKMIANGRIRQSGESTVDATGSLTIPGLVIETAAAELRIGR
jgi:hypothetical protein